MSSNPIHRRGAVWSAKVAIPGEALHRYAVVEAPDFATAVELLAPLGQIEHVVLTHFTDMLMRPERQVGAIAEATNG